MDDPYFKRTHYIHSRDNKKLLFAERLLDKNETYNFYTSSLSMVEDKQKLSGPTSCNPVDAILFCSCDGLVLIRVCSRKFCEELLLWNPSTRESILLPHPEFPLLYYVFGMEYDATSEGYKIVAVNLNGRNSINISVECLSRTSPSWRRKLVIQLTLSGLRVIGIVVLISWRFYMEHFIGLVSHLLDIILSFR